MRVLSTKLGEIESKVAARTSLYDNLSSLYLKIGKFRKAFEKLLGREQSLIRKCTKW